MDGSLFINPFPGMAITDVVDILLVASLLYTFIVWARKTPAALVLRGILILGAIYLIARQLDMQLTAWIFGGFFAIFLIIIVVIFQEELRLIFERIAVWSFWAKPPPPPHSEPTDILVKTVADLAKAKIGALIVVRGGDPIERHIVGGIPLGGSLSEPLLKSIFDPHSPGHDGAVIIEEGRVARFATHLPLSSNLRQLAHVGTRHSAALGLTELTDALSVVVSEERGTISVARDGRLRQLDNLNELRAFIRDFLEEKYPSTQRGKIQIVQFLRENWVAKVTALSLAFGFWYLLVPGSKIVEVVQNIPVQIENLPPDLQLERLQPEQIRATFLGPRRAFYLFDRGKLKATVDVSMAEVGRRTFQISDQDIRYPKDLILQELSPTTLRISVRKVPVEDKSAKGKPESEPAKQGT